MFEEPIRLAASGLSPISVAPPRSIATWLFRRRDQNRLRDRIEAEEVMYHPSRGGVRGGRDQFKWDDVKVDKHRENYLGHSVNAPVGRWQKGKDLFWYTRDKQSASSEMDSIREEIKRIKEDEEQAMREALGLAPKRASRPQGNRLDQHEYTELVKRGSTADDLGAQHAEAIMVQGLGLYKAPRNQPDSSTLQRTWVVAPGKNEQTAISESAEDLSTDKSRKRKRRRREETDERRLDGSRDEHRKHHEKKRSHDSDDKRIHQSRHKGKRRHDSD